MDCYRIGEPVSVPDITTEQERWPKPVAAMTENGYESVQAIPVRLHERPLGALTLLRQRSGTSWRTTYISRRPSRIPPRWA